MEEPSENQLGPSGGRSGMFSVITMNVINEAVWIPVHDCYAHASVGVTVFPRQEGGNKEKALSLSYTMQTSSHVSAPFTMTPYLKFIFTDSNDKVYP